jgi:hypothetical protein
VQGRQVVVDLHRHDGLRALVEVDVGDAADRLAADAHLVAVDELAGVLEEGLDPIRAVVAEHRERRQSHGDDDRRDGDYACGRRAAFISGCRPNPSLSLFLRVQARSIDRRLPRGASLWAALLRPYSIPSGPCASPDKNCLTNWLSELNSSLAGPDSTILPFHRIAM